MCSTSATEDTQPDARPPHSGQIVLGIVLVTLGLLTLVDRLRLLDVDAMALFPGLIVSGFGVLRLTGLGERHPDTQGRRNTVDGLWTLAVGLWLMANAAHVFGFTYGTSWPYLLIAAGVFLVARGWGR